MQYVDIAVSIAFHTEFARKDNSPYVSFRLPLDEMEKTEFVQVLACQVIRMNQFENFSPNGSIPYSPSCIRLFPAFVKNCHNGYSFVLVRESLNTAITFSHL